MSKMVTLELTEALPVDLARIKEIYSTMRANEAEDLMSRGFDTLAENVTEIETLYNQSRFSAMHAPLLSIKETGRAVGLTELSKQAENVLDALETGDVIAISATVMRCLRNSAPLQSHTEPGISSIR